MTINGSAQTTIVIAPPLSWQNDGEEFGVIEFRASVRYTELFYEMLE